MTRRRREDKPVKEPPAKSRSRTVRSLIEEDTDMSRSTALERYEVESEEEWTSLKIPMNTEKTELKDGVAEKLERLKEELLDELKNQTGAYASLRMSSPFMARIQKETIPKSSWCRP